MLNIEEIREIVKMIDQSSVNEFNYETNGTSISLKKSNGVVHQVSAESTTVQPVETVTNVEQPAVQATQAEQVAESTKATVDYDYEIVSPMVGTLYRASSPEHDPFVEVGTVVQENSVVCIVEAMKLFNEIASEVNGEIVEVLVQDGELVEFGQPLFRVKTK
ncbi:MAG TPA: acetyl-CoA carboxylase biotin carboxyl carrier protein [Candidatus Avamphibacillus intestinigallinarum]|nr:acetyl-CoA carboxylase biotin carboxyl carrier protein [Candidatus Avamphibacillus intestinigallinarum]